MKKGNHRFQFLTPALTAFVLNTVFMVSSALGQNEPDAMQPYIESVEGSSQGMTLWQIMQSGGWIMILLGLISMFMFTLVAYLFLRLRTNRLIPQEVTRDLIQRLRQGNDNYVANYCESQDNMMARVLQAGLEKRAAGYPAVRDAVEMAARKESTSLWATLSYLSDIAAVAPMLGLLGTVVGMIQAFNTIAFQTAVVKPILLAGGVSKAMVTTAGGMVVAIIALVFYSFFRYRAQMITSVLEILTNDALEAFNVSQEKGGAKPAARGGLSK